VPVLLVPVLLAPVLLVLVLVMPADVFVAVNNGVAVNEDAAFDDGVEVGVIVIGDVIGGIDRGRRLLRAEFEVFVCDQWVAPRIKAPRRVLVFRASEKAWSLR